MGWAIRSNLVVFERQYFITHGVRTHAEPTAYWLHREGQAMRQADQKDYFSNPLPVSVCFLSQTYGQGTVCFDEQIISFHFSTLVFP